MHEPIQRSWDAQHGLHQLWLRNKRWTDLVKKRPELRANVDEHLRRLNARFPDMVYDSSGALVRARMQGHATKEAEEAEEARKTQKPILLPWREGMPGTRPSN